MPSVRKIAKKANVSIATVSRAMNDSASVSPETKKRVMAAINEAQYFNAVGKRVTTNVGLVFTTTSDFYAFDALLLAGIVRGLAEQKFDVTVINMERDKTDGESFTQFFLRKGIRGAILRSPTAAKHVAEAVAAENFPHVAVAQRFENPAVNFIAFDSGAESKRAVEHLIQLGHKRIALGVHHVPDPDHLDRQEGYKRALEGAGIGFDPSLVLPLVANFQGGVSGLNQLLALQAPPTAIYFTDPLSALGALCRAATVGLQVPKDLSIVGFDDADTRYQSFPPMSAVCQNVSVLGHEAALWLTRRIAGVTKEPIRRILPAMFEVNASTSVPPGVAVRILPNGERVQN